MSMIESCFHAYAFTMLPVALILMGIDVRDNKGWVASNQRLIGNVIIANGVFFAIWGIDRILNYFK
jgi:hypothetical protein